MIRLHDIIHYGEYYPEYGRTLPDWWYSTFEEKVISYDDLIEERGYSIESLKEQNQYIPLFQVNMFETAKEFWESCVGKRKKAYQSPVDPGLYDIQFRIFIEENHLEERWHQFLEKRLIDEAKKWCRYNSIPFIQ